MNRASAGTDLSLHPIVCVQRELLRLENMDSHRSPFRAGDWLSDNISLRSRMKGMLVLVNRYWSMHMNRCCNRGSRQLDYHSPEPRQLLAASTRYDHALELLVFPWSQMAISATVGTRIRR